MSAVLGWRLAQPTRLDRPLNFIRKNGNIKELITRLTLKFSDPDIFSIRDAVIRTGMQETS